MSKLNLFFVSLVAAIPAGVLSTVLAMNFLTRADKMEGMLQIVSILTLAMSALVTFLPVGILIFSAKTEKPAEEVKKEMPSSASQAEVAVVDEDPGSEVLIPSRDSGEFDMTESELPAFDSDADSESAFQTEAEMESVDFDEDFGADFDDEPKPKAKGKGKKKR